MGKQLYQMDKDGIVKPVMTLRQHYAGLAMEGILANRELQHGLAEDRMTWEEFAVEKADALIKELEK